MNIQIYSHGRRCHADGIYMDGHVRVLKGSKLLIDGSSGYSKNQKILSMRQDKKLVGDEGELLVDCTFETPTAAAIFVAGSSRSGYVFWKVRPGVTLGHELEEKGIIKRVKRNKQR